MSTSNPYYYDNANRPIVVSTGIASGLAEEVWGVYQVKPNGSLRRVIASRLALTTDRAALLAAMTSYAADHGWRPA